MNKHIDINAGHCPGCKQDGIERLGAVHFANTIEHCDTTTQGDDMLLDTKEKSLDMSGDDHGHPGKTCTGLSIGDEQIQTKGESNHPEKDRYKPVEGESKEKHLTGDDSMKEQIEEILSDFNYHNINECATMDIPYPFPCGHTGCGTGTCKEELERVKQCNCGGEQEYQADIKAILALFQSQQGCKHKTEDYECPCWKDGYITGEAEAQLLESKTLERVREITKYDVGAIPETNDYANGWNACRQEVYQLIKKPLLELLEAEQKGSK